MSDSNLFTEMLKFHFEQSALYEKTWEEWRQECNAKGLEIYYDMSDAKEVSAPCDCDEECDETHTMKIGTYRTRPCDEHFPGHVCNPPRFAKITGLSVSGIGGF
jgi:hypothetical protein